MATSHSEKNIYAQLVRQRKQSDLNTQDPFNINTVLKKNQTIKYCNMVKDKICTNLLHNEKTVGRKNRNLTM